MQLISLLKNVEKYVVSMSYSELICLIKKTYIYEWGYFHNIISRSELTCRQQLSKYNALHEVDFIAVQQF